VVENEKLDVPGIEEKWRKRWEEAKLFEAEPDEREKFFLTFPYPYMNGYQHVGHFFTLMRVEAMARFKRMRGFNVLFPQGWHCTGSPIESAAKRVREGEKKQIKIMEDMGFSKEGIQKFGDPHYWTTYFPREYEADYRRMGISIDTRRQFITTSLNPYYDKFIRWQFRKLKEAGHVVKGRHPVIWCQSDNSPVGDHSRVKGEGETPQEFTLLKLKFEGGYLIAATLRPETVYGQTNIWVGPDIQYVKATVARTGKEPETWYVSKECAEKLKEQEYEVMIEGIVKATELIGRECLAPAVNRKVQILPSSFCDPNRGTGIVTSVPSDAPDDWMALQDLKNDPSIAARHGLDIEELRKIEAIPIIHSEELGDLPAKKVCEELGVKNQADREKLEKAKKIVYKKGYYTGRMTAACGEYEGLSVEEAKGKIKDKLRSEGNADIMYEPSGEVVCRCLTPSIVKIVSNQWFLGYGNENWKDLAKQSLKNVRLYPEKVRSQFEHVLDWLHDWACTREYGLGTKLPWDEDWVIESLSDSTIYMSFYTIVNRITDIDPNDVDDALFDYIFLGKDGRLKVDKKVADEMRQQFEYYYPVDFRNSGKDLVQNHLSFFLFIHAAIFPEKHWPKGIGVNGWITVDGEKMSKSLGNFILTRQLEGRFGVDASRFTIMNGGEGLDDPNWDSEMARTMGGKLLEVYRFSVENYGQGRGDRRQIDDWLDSQMASIIVDTTSLMEETRFRSALQRSYFDLQNALRWYLRRARTPNQTTISNLIETQLLLLAPFTPFICEEIWEKIGKDGFISVAPWPEANNRAINPELDAAENLVRATHGDITTVIGLAKLKNPKEILLFVAAPWKYALFDKVRETLEESREFSVVMGAVMKDPGLKRYGKEISKLLPSLINDPPGRYHLLPQKLLAPHPGNLRS